MKSMQLFYPSGAIEVPFETALILPGGIEYSGAASTFPASSGCTNTTQKAIYFRRVTGEVEVKIDGAGNCTVGAYYPLISMGGTITLVSTRIAGMSRTITILPAGIVEY
jgi:hypothetical protein